MSATTGVAVDLIYWWARHHQFQAVRIVTVHGMHLAGVIDEVDPAWALLLNIDAGVGVELLAHVVRLDQIAHATLEAAAAPLIPRPHRTASSQP